MPDKNLELKIYKILVIFLLIAMTIIAWLNYATNLKNKKIINDLRNQVTIVEQ